MNADVCQRVTIAADFSLAAVANACPSGASIMRLGGNHAHQCIGGRARGEPHRLHGGYTWPADPSETRSPPITVSIHTGRST